MLRDNVYPYSLQNANLKIRMAIMWVPKGPRARRQIGSGRVRELERVENYSA